MQPNIPKYPNYHINEKGEVFNLKNNRILKHGLNAYGYPQVTLCNKGKSTQRRVHRLIAQAYILNTHNKPCINHIDHDKLNHSILNLEWCTHKENNSAAVRYYGKFNRKSSHTKLEYFNMLVEILNGETICNLEIIHNTSASTLYYQISQSAEENGKGPELQKALHKNSLARSLRHAEQMKKTKSQKIIQLSRDKKVVINTFYSISEASRITGIGKGGIAYVARGERSHAGGFYWKYANDKD